ncbi:hypothetical protein H310_12813 [Aphanomyces invadans]|uniref:GH18 domain-containing protein n=1 Tax=Aphanomyces invadans TaxID=157072 RepID=A0A024THZ5_9STRA|nr:hypothetical protein H310_12813 [Aphanomyces invadans]ETV93216.1 hypothetical protein H310_12813 [Aphanomyces invadans]|eukprot:XP_008878238.1 hypothetical protein H310_12813 [Aphanomyces invadans]
MRLPFPNMNGTLALLDPMASLGKPNPSVTGQLQGHLGLANSLKRLNRATKVGLSIAGYTGSGALSTIAASPTLRDTFVAATIQLVEDLGLDHIDLDWEFPAASDMANFVALLRQLKAALAALPYSTELTIAAPGYDVSAWIPRIRLVRLIPNHACCTYDFMGDWSPVAGYHSNLDANPTAPPAAQLSVDRTVKFSSKTIARRPNSWSAPQSTAACSTRPAASTRHSRMPVQYNAIPIGDERFDDPTQSAFVYSATTRQLIVYDSPRSIAAKATYVEANQLGGIMFWEASGDRSGARGLVPTPVDTLSMSAFVFGPNNLSYPRSKYNNVAAPPPPVAVTLVTRPNKVITPWNGTLTVAETKPEAPFTYDPTTQLLSSGSAGCVDAYPSASSLSQYSVHLWPCSSTNANQQWILDMAEHHVRHATHANVCLDVDGSTVHVWWCHSINLNQWLDLVIESATLSTFHGRQLTAVLATRRVAFQPNGHAWTFHHVHQTIEWGTSGLYLDAYQPWNGGALRHVAHTGFCLDMATDTGTSPHVWSCHASQNWYCRYQQFTYSPMDSTFRGR